MKEVKYVEGDLFAANGKLNGTLVVPHVCNDAGAWGAGFVVPLGRNFPTTQERYRKWYGGSPPPEATYPGGLNFGLGKTQNIEVHADQPRVIVANMIAQHMTGGVRPLRYNALAACMDQVVGEFDKYDHPEIHAPMFGSALAGGDWNFIEQLVTDCWLRRDVDVTIYYLPGTLPSNWTPKGSEHAA